MLDDYPTDLPGPGATRRHFEYFDRNLDPTEQNILAF